MAATEVSVMVTEIRVPALGESVLEATIGQWFKKPGETVAADEALVELETDKVTVEMPAPAAGVLVEIVAQEGDTVAVGALLGTLSDQAAAKAPVAEAVLEPAATSLQVPLETGPQDSASILSPAVHKLIEDHDLDANAITGTGKGGRIMKADVLALIDSAAEPASDPAPVVETAPEPVPAPSTPPGLRVPASAGNETREQRVRMTRLRQTIAKRLKDVQNTAAILTTFNEVDMTSVIEARAEYKEVFEKKHGVKLGFMGFFIKACIAALKDIPEVNAEIDGTDLIYKNYYHIGVAVGAPKGLVVPVIREADQMNLAQIETAIAGFVQRARDGELSIEEMQGGTFTISNGGVYGSLMSTPILNAPQSGILGMHKIQERPMVVDGQIVARPMMYLALSYDHRVVDGKEAVMFLARVIEGLEDPQRMLLDI